MRTLRLWLALALCAFPSFAQKAWAQTAARRVVAPCELTTASVVLSGKESEDGGREFAVRVINNSQRTIALPRSPVFGWRVESLERKDWRLVAEGGPARRVHAKDEHIVIMGDLADAPLLEILPAHSQDFYTYLPEAEKALQPREQLSTLKLTLYWAAYAGLAQTAPAVPVCALAPEWVASMQKLTSK